MYLSAPVSLCSMVIYRCLSPFKNKLVTCNSPLKRVNKHIEQNATVKDRLDEKSKTTIRTQRAQIIGDT